MKGVGMLVVSLRVVNFGFWAHLGCAGKTPPYLALKASFRVACEKIYRGYYTVARRYEFYFRVVKYCFCHEKIKFVSSSRHVMFFLLYRQNDMDKIIEGNYQNYLCL